MAGFPLSKPGIEERVGRGRRANSQRKPDPRPSPSAVIQKLKKAAGLIRVTASPITFCIRQQKAGCRMSYDSYLELMESASYLELMESAKVSFFC